MKHIRKMLSVFAALMMVLGIGLVTARANEPVSGTITVNNATVGKEYTLYKLFDANVDENDPTHASYTATKAQKEWFEATANGCNDLFDFATTGDANLFTVSLKTGKTSKDILNALTKGKLSNADVFTKVGNPVTATSKTVTFDVTTTGYYLVASEVGALVSITTNSPNATVNDKNEIHFEKTIDESNKNSTNQVGDTITYNVELVVFKGMNNVTITDKMTKGLTFNNDVKVTVDGTLATSSEVFTVTSENVNNTTGETSFNIVLNENFLTGIETSKSLVFTYTATVNSDAVTVNEMTNTASVNVGNGPTDSSTYSYTGNVSLFKFAKDGANQTSLAGVEFELWKKGVDGQNDTLVMVVEEAAGQDGIYIAHSAPVLEKVDGVSQDVRISTLKTTNAAEKNLVVKGLPAGTYYFKETKALPGYNLPTSNTEVTISTAANGVAGQLTITDGSNSLENNKGTQLPSTGGMGTTMLYFVGGALVIVAGLFLVTKKRMGVR